VTADTRDYPGHPYRGGLYRAAWSAYSDRDLEAFSFHRYELEAAQFVTVAPDRWTIALHGWSVISDTASGQQVPVYLLPSLGGSTTLRSYADYRFHDRHMLLLSAESRWALFTHVDAALFVDAGSVAPRVRDLDLSTTSYGIGFRIHAHQSTTARLDVARGAEGWRILLRLDEPFRLSRLSRHMAAIPFVP
jgi:outer membrane protein assembly factor BamA